MAVSSPSLVRSRETYLLSAAAQGVAANLYSARINAITRNRDCRLRVSSNTTYMLECENGGWELVGRTELRQGLAITANARPEFHPRGNVSPTATISVWDSTGRVKRVVVNINGRVRIQ